MKNYIKRMKDEWEWMPDDIRLAYVNHSLCLYSNDSINIYMHPFGGADAMPIANLVCLGNKEDAIEFIRSLEEALQ